MALQRKKLAVKKSGIPGAGKGLFTSVPISRNTRIVEYNGILTTWSKVKHDEGKNRYIFYVNRNHVIDASGPRASVARYANDANGLRKAKRFRNNAAYRVEDGKVYIVATKDIPAGGEILVSYGKEYWDVIRHNRKIERKEARDRVRQRD